MEREIETTFLLTNISYFLRSNKKKRKQKKIKNSFRLEIAVGFPDKNSKFLLAFSKVLPKGKNQTKTVFVLFFFGGK